MGKKGVVPLAVGKDCEYCAPFMSLVTACRVNVLR